LQLKYSAIAMDLEIISREIFEYDVEVLHNGSIHGVDIDRFKDNFS